MKLEFLGGEGRCKTKTFCGEGMDIFWNYTFCNAKGLKDKLSLLFAGLSVTAISSFVAFQHR